MSVLTVRGLGVRLGGQSILEDIGLSVERRSIHALIGPNGGGKTTLIRAILGDVPYTGGIELELGEAGGIGYVPQFLQFDAALPCTVGDFFLMMLERRPLFWGRFPKRRRELAQLLARTECEHLLDRPLGRLSGGELRRVLLAQSLIPRPELLLLDEPASNVDFQGARMMEALLRRLRDEEGLTILMVEHDVPMLLRLADRVTGVNRGVTYDGPPQGLADVASLERLFQAPSGGA